jgi:hypothetical protein
MEPEIQESYGESVPVQMQSKSVHRSVRYSYVYFQECHLTVLTQWGLVQPATQTPHDQDHVHKNVLPHSTSPST